MRGRENGELLFDGHRISVWDDRKLLEMDRGYGILSATELNTLKWKKK